MFSSANTSLISKKKKKCQYFLKHTEIQQHILQIFNMEKIIQILLMLEIYYPILMG